MRALSIASLILALASCQAPEKQTAKAETPDASPSTTAPTEEVAPAPWDVKSSVVRVNSTQQTWNLWQPWEKNAPEQRRALAAIVGRQLVITTAELIADATYIELESADGSRFLPARVIAVDYEVNLALLGPASEDKAGAFFEGTVPFEIASTSAIGDSLKILQLEDNGVPIFTEGTLQSVDVTSNFLPGQNFLTYRVKASMQSASSSYTLPVLSDRKLAGVLISYNSKDQRSDVISTDILARFIRESSKESYEGFPSLGASIAWTEDNSFRKWLKLSDDQGGIYIRSIRKGGAADQAGLLKGDVLLAVDGQQIDRRGFYEHPNYGSVSWGHLVRGEKSSGDETVLSILRNGEPLELKATVKRDDENARLVPDHLHGTAPNYLVKGGLVFQELSLPLMQSFGDEWRTRVPLNLLNTYENPEDYQESMDRVVFLSGTIPTPATVGYERLSNLIVRKVNGKEIRNMKSLIHAFDENSEAIHTIEFADENLTIHLDELLATNVDTELLKRGITRLSRAE